MNNVLPYGFTQRNSHVLCLGRALVRVVVVLLILSFLLSLSGKAEAALYYGSADTGSPTTPNPTLFTFEAAQPQVDEVSGAYTQRVPLMIPPGRKGLQPDLALEYNSQNAHDGIVGYGWNLSIPYIERINKDGTERLYNNNYFTSSLGGELATTSATSTEYTHKVEDGRFIRYTLSNNVWTAYDKSGNKYLFGVTSDARQSTTSDRVYKWYLEEIRDTNDNYISYSYWKNNNEVYPQEITYTGNNVTDGIFSVEFATSTRPDPYTKYKGGIKVLTNYRISEVKALVSGSWVNKYTLSYTT